MKRDKVSSCNSKLLMIQKNEEGLGCSTDVPPSKAGIQIYRLSRELV
jgi:hypothetical protein